MYHPPKKKKKIIPRISLKMHDFHPTENESLSIFIQKSVRSQLCATAGHVTAAADESASTQLQRLNISVALQLCTIESRRRIIFRDKLW